MPTGHDENEVRLRIAQLGDAAAIASLLLAAFEEYRPLYTEGGFAATTPGPGKKYLSEVKRVS